MIEFLASLDRNVAVGMAQAAAAIALCLGVVVLCRRFAVHIERETVISLARGLIQMVAVGLILALLLRGSMLIGVLILLAMTVAAAVTASRRAPGIKNPLILSFYAIGAGSSVVIAILFATRTITSDIVVLVPVGSMIIANAMNACGQAMERFRADIIAHVGLIETGLSLGADPAATVRPTFKVPSTRACFSVSISSNHLALSGYQGLWQVCWYLGPALFMRASFSSSLSP